MHNNYCDVILCRQCSYNYTSNIVTCLNPGMQHWVNHQPDRSFLKSSCGECLSLLCSFQASHYFATNFSSPASTASAQDVCCGSCSTCNRQIKNAKVLERILIDSEINKQSIEEMYFVSSALLYNILHLGLLCRISHS